MSVHAHGNGGHAETPEFRIAFLLNLGFCIVEIIGGILTRSTAILADALHDLGDSLALAVSWWMETRSRRPGDQAFTFGYQRFSLLGGVVSAVVLSAGAGVVLSQAVPRILSPGNPHADGMVILAVAGILVNTVAAWRMRNTGGLNARMVTWHLVEDILGWVAVLAGGLVIKLWGLVWVDPLLSILISLLVLRRVYVEMRRGIRVFLQGVPEGMSVESLEKTLRGLPGVADVHHLHLWSLDGEKHVLTSHLVLEREMDAREVRIIKEHARALLTDMPVVHSTIEIEYPGEPCRVDETES